MLVSTFLIIMAVIVGCVILFIYLGDRRSGLNRSQKAELAALRQFKREVNTLAVQHQQIEPNLSACILDEVYKYETKELK